MAVARRANIGDPGLFGFLGDVAKTAVGLIPGPVGTVARAGIDALGGGGGGSAPAPTKTLFKGPPGASVPTTGGISGSPVSVSPPILVNGSQSVPKPPNGNGVGASISINPPFGGPPGIGVTTHFGPTGGGGARVDGNGREIKTVHDTNGDRPAGHHLNKTSYFLKDGTFVPKGTRWVKNRRKNPLNPKAASRAIRRLESAKKAVRRLDRVSIKCKRCGCARCKC